MKLSGKLAEMGIEPFIKEKFRVGSNLMPKIWIVVVDVTQVHFFRKTEHRLEKIGESFPSQVAELEINNNTAGHVNDFVDGERHLLEAHYTDITHGNKEFLKALAVLLDEAAVKQAYDRLVLAAPPHILEILRPLLSRAVHERIIAELNKGLTHLKEDELHDYLDKIVWLNN